VPGTDPVENPAFTEAFDIVGFSYYGTSTRNAEGKVGPYPPATELGPIGYSPSSDGIKVVLDRLHAELPGKPVLVSEHGVGTDDDAKRCAIVDRSLGLVREAIAEGVPVKGFFHWTGVDNYEWTHGYDLPFGLFGRDRNPRPSADLMASYAAGNRSSRTDLDQPVQRQGDPDGPA
jgi:beta-glucosidase